MGNVLDRLRAELAEARKAAVEAQDIAIRLADELDKATACDGVTMFGADMTNGLTSTGTRGAVFRLSLAVHENGRWVASVQLVKGADRPSLYAHGATPAAAAMELERVVDAFAQLMVSP